MRGTQTSGRPPSPGLENLHIAVSLGLCSASWLLPTEDLNLGEDRWVRSGVCPMGEDLRINPGSAFPQPPVKTGKL